MSAIGGIGRELDPHRHFSRSDDPETKSRVTSREAESGSCCEVRTQDSGLLTLDRLLDDPDRVPNDERRPGGSVVDVTGVHVLEPVPAAEPGAGVVRSDGDRDSKEFPFEPLVLPRTQRRTVLRVLRATQPGRFAEAPVAIAIPVILLRPGSVDADPEPRCQVAGGVGPQIRLRAAQETAGACTGPPRCVGCRPNRSRTPSGKGLTPSG